MVICFIYNWMLMKKNYSTSNKLHNLISACIPALFECDNVSVSIISFACCLGTTDPHMWPTIFFWEYASEEGLCGTLAYLQALANEWWKTGNITATNLLQWGSWPYVLVGPLAWVQMPGHLLTNKRPRQTDTRRPNNQRLVITRP